MITPGALLDDAELAEMGVELVPGGGFHGRDAPGDVHVEVRVGIADA
jgi:hypothetical protein